MFFFGIFRPFNAKSDAINQVTLADRPVCHPWSISVFKLHVFWLEFWTFCLKFYTISFC